MVKVPSSLGEWVDVTLRAKQALDPWARNAWEAAGEAKDQSEELWRALQENEDLQKTLAETREAAGKLAEQAAETVREQDFEQLKKDAEVILQKARDRWNEQDVQELRQLVEETLWESKDRILGGEDPEEKAPKRGWWALLVGRR